MNLDFLSGLLGGQNGNSMLGMLLPLILGGNKGGISSSVGGNLGGILSAFTNEKGKGNENAFPPLFGSDEDDSGQNGIWNMIGSLLPKSGEKAPVSSQSHPNYPYELQYNRPYRGEKSS